MANMAVMFPGQGSQSVGMAKEVLEQFPFVQTIFEEAEDATKLPIRKLCKEGPEDQLQLTAHQQPCILTVSLAIWEVLKRETEIAPSLFAGHSLGEYSALVASEKFSLWNAAQLVYLRGQAMQAAVPENKGAMAAVIGADEKKLLSLCKKASMESHQGTVELVNFNSPTQHIISGTKAEVSLVCEWLTQDKIRSKVLPVSAPFHSSLMTQAKEKMSLVLKEAPMSNTPGRIIANLTGAIESPYKIELLIEQIDHPVLWTKSMETALENGTDFFLEVGPGSTLCGLAKRWFPENVELKHTLKLAETVLFLQKRPSSRK